MICDRFNTIFVHIPKAAGQSIEHVFLSKMGLTWPQRAPLLLRENSDPRLGPERLAHLCASEYVSCGHVAQADFDAYFKFAVVRNPWARLVSEYKFSLAGRGVSFADFLFKHFPPPGLSDGRRHVEPQWKFVCDADGQLAVDQIIRFETLAEDIGPVFTRIFGEPTALPRVNAARDQRDYRAFYDGRTRAFVEDMYRGDIELFQYAFD
jgi:hypothetical protein